MLTTQISTTLGPQSTLADCLEQLGEYADEPIIVQFAGTKEYLGRTTTVRQLATHFPNTKANSVAIGYESRQPGYRTSGSILSFAATRRMDMAHIDDIRKTLRDLTDEELDEIIRGKRQLRRDTAETVKKRAVSAKPKKSHAADTLEQLKALPPEVRLELLRQLGESK